MPEHFIKSSENPLADRDSVRGFIQTEINLQNVCALISIVPA